MKDRRLSQLNSFSVHLCAVSSVSGFPHHLFTHLYVRYMFTSAFTLPSSLPEASPFSASQFLKEYDKEFLDIVNAKQSLLKLKYNGVISADIASAIATANDEDAKYLLFEHLDKNATVDTLREYCEVAIAADGFPKMQAFGKKMMEALPLGGWLELCLWLVHICALHMCLCHTVYRYI